MLPRWWNRVVGSMLRVVPHPFCAPGVTLRRQLFGEPAQGRSPSPFRPEGSSPPRVAFPEAEGSRRDHPGNRVGRKHWTGHHRGFCRETSVLVERSPLAGAVPQEGAWGSRTDHQSEQRDLVSWRVRTGALTAARKLLYAILSGRSRPSRNASMLASARRPMATLPSTVALPRWGSRNTRRDARRPG